jgi:hypothetical protein
MDAPPFRTGYLKTKETEILLRVGIYANDVFAQMFVRLIVCRC